MNKLGTLEELRELRKRIIGEKAAVSGKPTLVVSAGTCGQASGANDIIRAAKRHILDRELQDEVAIRITGCQGYCEIEPFIVVEPWLHVYPKIRMDDAPRIIDAAIEGRSVEDLLYRDRNGSEPIPCQDDIPFFAKQTRTILGPNLLIDPIRILHYLEQGGYAAAEKVLSRLDADEIIEEVKRSGLRGRGGAGFSTGRKWELARAARSPDGRKFIVCNADEGDPGAYMDRSLLEGNPHAIIEGLLIAGLAIGATQGVIYVRSEYPLAIKHAIIALRQARDLGVLGEDILSTGVEFDIEIVRGAGAFVCGEETALIRSVQGLRGEPRQRPPYPIEKGIDGCPTCINNVETLANVPVIVLRGAEEYAKVGTPGNTGTKIFSLVGKIRNTGLVEVPLGMSIGEVVHDIGGGAPGRGKIKAVQTGGPSGGCIPAHMFDLPIDYDSLAEAGSIMGSGGMIVMDESTCLVDVAKYFMGFLKEESCGKCFTCRKGTQRMYEILDDITRGRGRMEDLDLLEELAVVVRDTSMCGLGQSAANPVLSTLRYFRNEYVHHIRDKKCDALVCRDLVGAPCQSACPVGTEVWRYVAHIARGEMEEAYRVIRTANPFPSVCARVCHHPCEAKCRAGTSGGDPLAIRALKRAVTDRVDPAEYVPDREEWTNDRPAKVAIVGAGPAGLTAAHLLSLKGCKVTVYESEDEPGGMLHSTIPSYRLPRDVIRKEIAALLDENITLERNRALGRDFTVDDLFRFGNRAVLLAIGAHRSKPLRLPNEDVAGVLPSIEFLKAYSTSGQRLARGKVGVIGGGNSAIDAARTALRLEEVDQVTILYRRTRAEMPAFPEEIEAADQEGIEIRTLVTPTRILAEDDRLTGLECVTNALGDTDSSGRRRPVPVPDTEHVVDLDTLIVAVGEEPGVESIGGEGGQGVEVTDWRTVQVNRRTLQTSRDGVFAAGDVVTGPGSVVEAIADGKQAATSILRYLHREPLIQPTTSRVPDVYVAPPNGDDAGVRKAARAETPHASPPWRTRSFTEVEAALSLREAADEARRCLRCDLEFTTPDEAAPDEAEAAVSGRQTA